MINFFWPNISFLREISLFIMWGILSYFVELTTTPSCGWCWKYSKMKRSNSWRCEISFEPLFGLRSLNLTSEVISRRCQLVAVVLWPMYCHTDMPCRRHRTRHPTPSHFNYPDTRSTCLCTIHWCGKSYNFPFQCFQNKLYLKYYTSFWESARIILYFYFYSVKYFKNTLL